jgi:putative membrane protein
VIQERFMKHSVYLVASVAALALAGCKKSETPANDVAATSSTAAADTSMPAPAATANADQAFADTAAASDAFEIQTSQLALTKAKSAKTKTFAQAMIKAHTDSTSKLKAAAAKASPAITPQPQLTPMQQQTLEKLTAQSGAEFDTAYKQAQVDGHQMTLDKLKAYSASGAQPSLKAFATEMVPVVTGHLNMAKGL